MGKSWNIPRVALWREVYRTLKDGALVMAFAGTRTLDLMAAGIEAAGFQYVGTLAWMHGQGFPKSLNIGKALDKMMGEKGERGPMKLGGERLMNQAPGGRRDGGGTWGDEVGRDPYVYLPTSEVAKEWEGWGTALKPAWEPVLVFSKGPTSWQMPRVPFFYCAKAAKAEKNLDGEVENNHVTVKPVQLMEWLVGLASPKGGLILEPFLGSGTTAVACAEQGRDYAGIERDPAYFALAGQRVGIVQGRADEVAGQRAVFDLIFELDEE